MNCSGFNMFTKVKEKVVYCTHGRYIPNLTRQDGSVFEKYYVEMAQKNGAQPATIATSQAPNPA